MLPTAQELSNLIGLLYDAASDPQCWEIFLTNLANSTHAQSAALLVTAADTNCIEHSWRFDPELVQLHAEYYHSVDPWWISGSSSPPGTVRTSQSLCPISELKQTEAYNDCFHRFNILHGAFALLENRPRLSAAISLFRGPSAPEFQESETQILELLVPHLRKAFGIHRRLADLEVRAHSLEAAIDASSTPSLLLGARAQIVYMNRSALALLAEKDGLLVLANTLVADRRAEAELLYEAIRRASSMFVGNVDQPSGAVLISRRSRPALRVFVEPIRPGPLGEPGRVSVAVFVTDPLRAQTPTLQTLRTGYGLTPAEYRVAILLAEGNSPKEISAMLAVTEHTIRSQLKSVFAKTGVRRQAELVALILTSKPPKP